MLKVGLTGGYATGKSFVARELERLGCYVIRADELGHAVLEQNGEAYRPTLETFGPEILNEDGTINRKKLADIVFSSPELLEKLSGFVHPAVIRLEDQILGELQARNPNSIAVIEAAILIETGRHGLFDRLILTVCDEETQIARGVERDHLTREQVIARIEKQLPLEQKEKHADYVVDTSGQKEETLQQVRQIYGELKELTKAQAHES